MYTTLYAGGVKMTNDKDLLTAEELALVLNCSPQLIRKLKKTGKIPFIKIGYLVRFNAKDVLDVLKENTQKI